MLRLFTWKPLSGILVPYSLIIYTACGIFSYFYALFLLQNILQNALKNSQPTVTSHFKARELSWSKFPGAMQVLDTFSALSRFFLWIDKVYQSPWFGPMSLILLKLSGVKEEAMQQVPKICIISYLLRFALNLHYTLQIHSDKNHPIGFTFQLH